MMTMDGDEEEEVFFINIDQNLIKHVLQNQEKNSYERRHPLM